MATISLEMAKNELARDILGLTDIDTVMKLRRSYRRITQKSEPKWPKAGPFSYEEMMERISKSEWEAEHGMTVPTELVMEEARQMLTGR